MKELYSVPEFLSAYSIGRTTFYREVASGRLRIVKIGKASRVTREDAQAWAASLPSLSAAA